MELAKAYDPKAVEDRWYATWQERGYFHPTPGQGRPYCITIPPPNITGSLHIGHALNNSVLDVYTRWHRMLGDNTLCLPGTDHASIATQNVVERELAKEGLTRYDLGRDEFLKRCWQWREEYGTRIYLQLQKLGCSYDWERARFTLDASYVDAIYEEFLRWWERGLIYRGVRVVNWCPRCRSAISDIEVDSEERHGHLYHIRYPLADGSGSVVVATTRPETMLGDTAVAVNPADERYRALIGKMVLLPLTDRQIPIIADDYAKMEFGTGAVKVTPAHDLDDFECGLRHNLPQIVVIGEDGHMTQDAGPDYAGMDRFECRKQVLLDLQTLGALVKTEDYLVKVPLCDRCKTVLEPLLSEQWFARQKALAQPAIDVVQEGRIRFFPERYKRIYLDWLEGIRDWCISRQLWWGHRIPVWWTEDRRYTAARSAEDAAQKLGVPVESLRQDEDVLDTWFSSALWPHATLGWPRPTEDLAFWYPTDLLSTAQEILFLWVARMVMTGMDFMGEVPFRDVYVHATVLDERGERMSKSKGNGVDPLEMIDRYGADAMRFSLLQQAGMNQDIKFSEDRVKLAGQFCNKLWNASRFVIMGIESRVQSPESSDGKQEARSKEQGGGSGPTGHWSLVTDHWPPDTASLALPDHWILSRLHRTIAAVTAGMESYNLDAASRALYSFLWDEFCDWYLEMAKPRLRDEGPDREVAQRVLSHVLETTLRLMHPFTPFITEEIWQALRETAGVLVFRSSGVQAPEHPNTRVPEYPSLMLQPYPQADESLLDERAEERMALVIEATRALRNLRAENGVAPGARLLGAVVPASREAGVTLSDSAELVASLARLTELQVHSAPPSGDGTWVGTPIGGAEVYLEIGGALDVPRELERLARELAGVDKDLAGLQARLSNPSFVEKAAPAAVEKARAQAAELQERRASLEARRESLGR